MELFFQDNSKKEKVIMVYLFINEMKFFLFNEELMILYGHCYHRQSKMFWVLLTHPNIQSTRLFQVFSIQSISGSLLTYLNFRDVIKTFN